MLFGSLRYLSRPNSLTTLNNLYFLKFLIQFHGPSLKMFNYSAFQPTEMNSWLSHMKKIYRNDKIIKFLGEKSSILFSQHFDFVNKIKEIVKIKEKNKAMWTSCVRSLVQIGFTLETNALEWWPMGLPMVLSKKQGMIKFYSSWGKSSNVSNSLIRDKQHMQKICAQDHQPM